MKTLEETKSLLPPGGLGCTVCNIDITNEQAVKSTAEVLGIWDVLILSAGYISSPASIQDAVVGEWWDNFEVCQPAFVNGRSSANEAP